MDRILRISDGQFDTTLKERNESEKKKERKGGSTFSESRILLSNIQKIIAMVAPDFDGFEQLHEEEDIVISFDIARNTSELDLLLDEIKRIFMTCDTGKNLHFYQIELEFYRAFRLWRVEILISDLEQCPDRLIG